MKPSGCAMRLDLRVRLCFGFQRLGCTHFYSLFHVCQMRTAYSCGRHRTTSAYKVIGSPIAFSNCWRLINGDLKSPGPIHDCPLSQKSLKGSASCAHSIMADPPLRSVMVARKPDGTATAPLTGRDVLAVFARLNKFSRSQI